MKLLILNDGEINALKGLMDAGVKSLGLVSVIPAAILLQKIDNAQDAPLPDVPENPNTGEE